MLICRPKNQYLISTNTLSNLIYFHHTPMKQEACSCSSPSKSGSSPNKAEKLSVSVTPNRKFERVFHSFDEDGDGKISPAELRSCMRTVSEELSLEEAAAVVESIDSDSDGLLGFEDFLRWIETCEEEEKMKDLREAFEMYEMEGSGRITPKSLKRMLSRLGQSNTIDECVDMICRFDIDGDGVLSFEEFRLMMV